MTSASHAEGRQFDPGQVYFASCGGGTMQFAIGVWRLHTGFPLGIIRWNWTDTWELSMALAQG
jgi:hypothetical protein